MLKVRKNSYLEIKGIIMAVWISENISYIVICSDVNKSNSISMNMNKNSLIAVKTSKIDDMNGVNAAITKSQLLFPAFVNLLIENTKIIAMHENTLVNTPSEKFESKAYITMIVAIGLTVVINP